jgi:hypothetical protein
VASIPGLRGAKTLAAKLAAEHANATMSYTLATITTDVPLANGGVLQLLRAGCSPPDVAALSEIARELDMQVYRRLSEMEPKGCCFETTGTSHTHWKRLLSSTCVRSSTLCLYC